MEEGGGCPRDKLGIGKVPTFLKTRRQGPRQSSQLRLFSAGAKSQVEIKIVQWDLPVPAQTISLAIAVMSGDV